MPILVRPGDGGRYQLIYGRRRLAACEALGLPVRAIVADLDDDQALKDQLLENQARRDLSFIERALVAAQLLDSDQLGPDLRSGRGVAEVLGLTEAAVSQLLGVVRAVGPELIAAIGAAPGIGRPRWEDLKKRLESPSPPALGRAGAASARSRLGRGISGGAERGQDRPCPGCGPCAGRHRHAAHRARPLAAAGAAGRRQGFRTLAGGTGPQAAARASRALETGAGRLTIEQH